MKEGKTVCVCVRDIWKWKTNIAIWSRKIARPTKWITTAHWLAVCSKVKNANKNHTLHSQYKMFRSWWQTERERDRKNQRWIQEKKETTIFVQCILFRKIIQTKTYTPQTECYWADAWLQCVMYTSHHIVYVREIQLVWYVNRDHVLKR